MTPDPIAAVYEACRARANLPLWFAMAYGVGDDALARAWRDSTDGYAMWDLFEWVIEAEEEKVISVHDAVCNAEPPLAKWQGCVSCTRWWYGNPNRPIHQQACALRLREALPDPGVTLARLMPWLVTP